MPELKYFKSVVELLEEGYEPLEDDTEPDGVAHDSGNPDRDYKNGAIRELINR